MSALEKLIAAADGTTDESMHVLVPVSLIRELQACIPASAGVDPQSMRDEPEHVQRAEMDADIRQAAIDWSVHLIRTHCLPDTEVGDWGGEMPYDTSLFLLLDEPLSLKQLQSVRDRALRILRHFGLLVEHGEGVVSIRDNDEAHRRDAAGGPSGGADCSAA